MNGSHTAAPGQIVITHWLETLMYFCVHSGFPLIPALL